MSLSVPCMCDMYLLLGPELVLLEEVSSSSANGMQLLQRTAGKDKKERKLSWGSDFIL